MTMVLDSKSLVAMMREHGNITYLSEKTGISKPTLHSILNGEPPKTIETQHKLTTYLDAWVARGKPPVPKRRNTVKGKVVQHLDKPYKHVLIDPAAVAECPAELEMSEEECRWLLARRQLNAEGIAREALSAVGFLLERLPKERASTGLLIGAQSMILRATEDLRDLDMFGKFPVSSDED